MIKNLSLLADFYEFTMSQGYFENNLKDKTVVFDMFFRRVPDNGGYAIAAGLEQLVEYMKNLKFYDDDIEYLRSKNLFSEEFLNYLKEFKFECDVWAVKEGTPIFPNEPILVVKGPVIQAQLIETMVLLSINHQSLIATKASRIVRAAKGRAVMEFGSRRAQGKDGAVYGARAAYIGGCVGTSCSITDKMFNIPALGTMAHSWVQMFDTEYDAFKAYANAFPKDCTLLIDTYNVLKSGLPNAIKVFNEVILPKGFRPKGVRIDSGDITYLSKKVRKMLDENGFSDVNIIVSNSLDENIIRDTLYQGACIDIFGVGERLITSKSEPVFGGVYKLVSVFEDGREYPKIKISENVGKITNPSFKNLYRLYDKSTGKAIADVITLHDEEICENEPYVLFDPEYTWKKKTITDFKAEKLLVKIMDKGKLVYDLPKLEDIKEYSKNELDKIWDEVKRFENPHKYYVDLSDKLWTIKQKLLEENSK
ncbi:MAG: nicotinate phosphoribosyltransferase [Clostridia bacterium]|nr:nicotinate phosphoribosyltransferase [Oscillospiraceae bacterium]MBR4893363.1 nicotinate phosphoribosyltransferase [Clostridia bacterium]